MVARVRKIIPPEIAVCAERREGYYRRSGVKRGRIAAAGFEARPSGAGRSLLTTNTE
jgi:hypothetical protein